MCNATNVCLLQPRTVAILVLYINRTQHCWTTLEHIWKSNVIGYINVYEGQCIRFQFKSLTNPLQCTPMYTHTIMLNSTWPMFYTPNDFEKLWLISFVCADIMKLLSWQMYLLHCTMCPLCTIECLSQSLSLQMSTNVYHNGIIIASKCPMSFSKQQANIHL